MPKLTKSYQESLLQALQNPQEAAEYLTAALEDGDALLEGHPHRFELALVPPRGDPEGQPTTRHHVNRRRDLGEDDGVAQRKHEDTSPEPNPLGPYGDRGQH